MKIDRITCVLSFVDITRRWIKNIKRLKTLSSRNINAGRKI